MTDDQAEESDVSDDAHQNLDEARRKEVVLNYFELVNSADLDGVVKLFSPSATVTDPVGAPTVVGEQALREYFQRVIHVFGTKDVPGVPTGSQDGTSVAIPFKATINNPQDPTSGIRLDVNVVSIFSIGGDGLINDMRAYWGLTDIAPSAG